MPGSFFDTNVLLYVASGDSVKADRAERLISAGGIISVQVLNEIANVARRKMGMSWTQTRAFLSTIRGLLPVQMLTIEVHPMPRISAGADDMQGSYRLERNGWIYVHVEGPPQRLGYRQTHGSGLLRHHR